MDMQQVQQSIAEDLRQLADPLSQMEYLLACARACDGIPEEERRREDLVASCQAKTWVSTCWQNGRLHMQADSESFLIKGALALLCEVYEGRSREEIQGFSCHLLDGPGFTGLLTAEQRKGLNGVLEQLHREAQGSGEEAVS